MVKEQKQKYFEDQCLKELKSKVLKVDGNKVWIEENLFFPKTKSEPSDLGTVNNIKIVEVEKNNDEVMVILEKNPNFKEGQEVLQKIDWDKRYKSMKLHSALHLIAGIIEKEHGIRAVAGNVYSDKAVLIFKSVVSEMVFYTLEDKVEDLVNSSVEVETYWDEEKEGFRWCKVADFVPIPCGGLHVKKVGEIGKLELNPEGDKLEVSLK